MPEMLELLLVEDDPAIVSTLSDFLQQEGFSITAASGQRQATALLETRRFHLALLDVTLRDGSGFALCTAIKAQYRIPVIFLTALADGWVYPCPGRPDASSSRCAACFL